MKTNLFTLTLVVLLVGTLTSLNSYAVPAEWGPLENRAKLTEHLANPNTKIIASAMVRAGDDLSSEVAIGNFETYTDDNGNGGPYNHKSDFFWNINGINNFILYYNGANGDYSLTVSNTKGSVEQSVTVNTGPTDWFNQLSIAFTGGPAKIDVSGDVNGVNFSLMAPNSLEQSWGGVLFTFPDFRDGYVDSFTVTGDINISTLGPDLSQDDFRGEFLMLQTIPEPTSFALLFIGIIALANSRSRRKSTLC